MYYIFSGHTLIGVFREPGASVLDTANAARIKSVLFPKLALMERTLRVGRTCFCELLHGSESLDYSPRVDTTFEKYLCECVHVCVYVQVLWCTRGGREISGVLVLTFHLAWNRVSYLLAGPLASREFPCLCLPYPWVNAEMNTCATSLVLNGFRGSKLTFSHL